jgi:hypothetical protein
VVLPVVVGVLLAVVVGVVEPVLVDVVAVAVPFFEAVVFVEEDVPVGLAVLEEPPKGRSQAVNKKVNASITSILPNRLVVF